MAKLFHESLAMLLRTAYLRLHRATNRNFQPFHSTADQYVLLRLLRDDDGLTQQELTVLTSSDPTTIGTMVRLLEKKGLVERRPDPDDGRAKKVFLTEAGRKICQQLYRSAAWIRERLEGDFNERELELLMQALNKIAEGFEPEAECLQGPRKWSPGKPSAKSSSN